MRNRTARQLRAHGASLLRQLEPPAPIPAACYCPLPLLRPLLAGLAALLAPVILPPDLPAALLRVYTRNGRVVLTEGLNAAEGATAAANGTNHTQP